MFLKCEHFNYKWRSIKNYLTFEQIKSIPIFFVCWEVMVINLNTSNKSGPPATYVFTYLFDVTENSFALLQ